MPDLSPVTFPLPSPKRVRCPFCKGAGVIDPRLVLTTTQRVIYDAVKASHLGLTASEIVRVTYAGVKDGGPLTASQAICSLIYTMNTRLRPFGEKVKSERSGRYRLFRI
jgi:hypothetical protein